jgi:signal transduction histidine kinase
VSWISALVPDARAWAAEDVRPFRYWGVVGSLSYRVMAAPVPLVALVFELGPRRTAPVLAITVVLLAVYGWGALRVTPHWLRDRRRALAVLLLDTAVVVAANLAVAALVQERISHVYWGVLWPVAQGSVTLWLAVFGLRAACLVVALGAPLFPLMLYVNGAEPWQGQAQEIVAHFLWLILALGVAQVVSALLRSRAVAALSEGQEVERIRSLRLMHDTALQALDAISLLASADGLDEEERRRLILATSRNETRLLRETLEPQARRQLVQEVEALVAAERRRGLPVRIERMVRGGVQVPPHIHDACCEALREALTNARQHADATAVVVRLRLDETILRIDVADNGAGFEVAQAHWGFGMSQSIVGRLHEVGATAKVASQPGVGTTIKLRAGWSGQGVDLNDTEGYRIQV